MAVVAAAVAVGACADDKTADVRDCEDCPAMIELPGGSFLMGTAEADRLIDPRTGKPATNDGPQHEVTIQPFAIGKFEVTVDEYRAFVDATGHRNDEGCMEFRKPNSFSITTDVDWDRPGFEQSGDSPVGCVSFYDAVAYTDWLSEVTGENYRLPTEAEWEYAARGGSTTPYFWGTDESSACDYANIRSPGADAISKRQAANDVEDGFACEDGAVQTSTVGSYSPNAFGLYDMQGNVWEWAADCNHKDYVGAPTDGSAWLDDEPCQFGIIRSGSFLNRVERSSTTVRAGRPQSGKATNMGFRVARGGEDSGVRRLPTEDSGTFTSAGPDPSESDALQALPGAPVFAENCEACHIDSSNYSGLYGRDQASVENAIRGGGNNVMSMPAFDGVLTDQQIADVAAYVRRVNGWD